MIDLSGSTPFAEGGNRKCFIHPTQSDRCLKVVHPGLLEKIIKSKPWYKKFRSKDSFDDNLREQEAYKQKALLANNSEVWKHIAKWYGMVETSIGMASETELIKNNDQIAETLENYLFSNGLTDEIKINGLKASLNSLVILSLVSASTDFMLSAITGLRDIKLNTASSKL